MRYRRIDVRIWGDEKFCSLSPLLPSAQGLFLYLLTNPYTTSIPGLFRAGPAAMAEELGWSIEGFKVAFDELIQHGLVKADLISRVIFIPNAIKYNKPENPNVVKSWILHWDEIPECALKNLAYQTLKIFVEGMSEGFVKAFQEGIRKPSIKTMPIQEQEQEQEQNKKINTCEVETSPFSVNGELIASTPETFENANGSEAKHLSLVQGNEIRKAKKKPKFEKEINEVWEYYKIIMNHPLAKLDHKRRKIIENALLGYSIDQLKQAIRGCSHTPFNMGENTHKKRYDDIELILRNSSNIERFIQNENSSIHSPNSLHADPNAAGAI